MKFLVMTLLAVWVLQGYAWAAPQSASKSQRKLTSKSPSAKSPGKPYARKKVVERARPAPVKRGRTKAAAAAKPRQQADRPIVDTYDGNGSPELRSSSAFVIDQSGRTLYAKNITAVQPIASITKLMTAMVVLDAKLDLNELIAITDDDVDELKHTRSRLQVGTMLSRDDLLRLALMASENRAASALGRAYPGGFPAFLRAMNQKAVALGMMSTHFLDSTGLNRENVSTAEDLAKLVVAAHKYPLIQQYTTLTEYAVRSNSGRVLSFRNSNGLIRSDDWQIDVSKTGYIQEAGRCLVMQARIAATPVIIVLLDSWGKYTRIADANRVKKWVESQLARPAPG